MTKLGAAQPTANNELPGTVAMTDHSRLPPIMAGGPSVVYIVEEEELKEEEKLEQRGQLQTIWGWGWGQVVHLAYKFPSTLLPQNRNPKAPCLHYSTPWSYLMGPWLDTCLELSQSESQSQGLGLGKWPE